MGQRRLARTARGHAMVAAALTWAILATTIACILLLPHGWFDALLPIDGVPAVAAAAIAAALAIALLPLERLGGVIVADLLGRQAHGRLQNVAEEVSIALGESPGHVIIHDSPIPNVAGFPTRNGVVVLATAGAVDQLRRDELEALVAAQLAGMRDPWCRLATRAELAWTGTKLLAAGSIVVAQPVAVFIAAGMVFAPRTVEATRDLCADVAAVDATRHPAGLASGLRHLAPVAPIDPYDRRQRLVTRWYLPLNPFLVLPRRTRSTTTARRSGKAARTWTSADEVAIELELRADRAEALANGGTPHLLTGREYRRRWAQLGNAD